MILAAAASFFPLTRFLLQHMIPKSILEKQREHTEFTNTKILQRLELKTDRPDLITPFLKDMKNSPDKMSLGEIQSTFAIILVAGSETTATTLLGVFYKLASNPQAQRKLSSLLRKLFNSEEEITVETTKAIPFLDAIINEALRLCYAVPGGLPRIAPEGGDIYAGHYVPGGVSLQALETEYHINCSIDGYLYSTIRALPLRKILQEELGIHSRAMAPFGRARCGVRSR